MSGPLSVPFTYLAIAASDAWVRGLFTVLAVLAAWVAAFQIWRAERAKVAALEQEVAPKLKLEFGQVAPFCYEVALDAETIPNQRSVRSLYRTYRFRVTNGGHKELKACKAQMKFARSETGQLVVGMPISLARSLTGHESFPLRIGEEKFVNIAAIPVSGPATNWGAKIAACGDVFPEGPMRVQSLPLKGAILPLEPTTVTIQVLSEASPPATMVLRLQEGPNGFELHEVVAS